MKLLEMFNDNYTEMYRFWFLPPNQSVKFNQGHTEFAYEHPEEFGLNIKELNMDDLMDWGICDNPTIFDKMFKKGWVRILYDITLNELAIDNPKVNYPALKDGASPTGCPRITGRT